MIPAIEAGIRVFLHDAPDMFAMLVARFPNHPRVRALAKDALADKNLACLANSAFDLLIRTEPDPAAVYAQVLQMYQNDKDYGAYYRLSVVRGWERFGPKNDLELTRRIVDECLLPSFQEELRAPALAFLKKVDPAVACDRLLAWARANLGRDRGANRIKIMDYPGFFKHNAHLREVPGFEKAIETVALELLDEANTTDRADGLKLLAAVGVRSPTIDRTLADLLEDGNVVVQIVAADTVAALKLDNDVVIERLDAMTLAGQQEMVRAAGIRNLALLRPEAPRTLEIARALANDPLAAVRTEAERVLRGDHKSAKP
jgi:hypothetical protein